MRAYLNIGSNLGDKYANINHAIALIESHCGCHAILSDWIESEPWGYDSPNQYVNIGVLVDVESTPHSLLDTLQAIERECGTRSHRNADGSYADRLIDIDIMDIDGVTLHDSDLVVPHPHLDDREFFKIPYLQLKKKSLPHVERNAHSIYICHDE